MFWRNHRAREADLDKEWNRKARVNDRFDYFNQ